VDSRWDRSRLVGLVGLDTSLAILDALFAEFAEPNFSPRPAPSTHGPRPVNWAENRDPASTTTVAREIEEGEMAQRSKPWVMRTYSGHSSAVASNKLYRSNLAKGQTGLSIAFDLPTQTGYDRTTRPPPERSARSACRSRTSVTCANSSKVFRSTR